MKKKLDAMVIGNHRSGSRWLRRLCAQHSDIYVCPVNLHGFLSPTETAELPKPAAFRRRIKRGLFGRMKFNCPMDQYQGEKVVLGMRNMQEIHGDRVAKMYYSYNKNMKFLLTVRNPIDRTFSHYTVRMERRINEGEPHPTFDINQELGIEQIYVQPMLIYSLLKPYLQLFPPEQFFIYPMELMLSDTDHWLNKVFAFLGVRQSGAPPDAQNLANPGKYDAATFVPMNAESKRYLVKLCMEEMKSVSELSGVDLVELWGLKNHLQETDPMAST